MWIIVILGTLWIVSRTYREWRDAMTGEVTVYKDGQSFLIGFFGVIILAVLIGFLIIM